MGANPNKHFSAYLGWGIYETWIFWLIGIGKISASIKLEKFFENWKSQKAKNSRKFVYIYWPSNLTNFLRKNHKRRRESWVLYLPLKSNQKICWISSDCHIRQIVIRIDRTNSCDVSFKVAKHFKWGETMTSSIWINAEDSTSNDDVRQYFLTRCCWSD